MIEYGVRLFFLLTDPCLRSNCDGLAEKLSTEEFTFPSLPPEGAKGNCCTRGDIYFLPRFFLSLESPLASPSMISTLRSAVFLFLHLQGGFSVHTAQRPA